MKLLSQIESIDRSLVRAEAALVRGEADVRTQAAACVAAVSAQAAARGAHDQAAAQLRRRLGALTRLNPAVRVTALGSVGGLSQLMDDERLLAAIAKHDRDLWAAHEATRMQLGSTIALATERAHALEAAQQERRAARDALAQTRERKNRTLLGMRRRNSRALRGELQIAQARLTQVVQQATDDPASPAAESGTPSATPTVVGPGSAKTTKLVRSGRSGLPWPASGPVRLGFGQHIETTFGTATFHNGWDIAAAAGSPVTAVASGVVAYAAWLYGYGQVAIVEHPGGYHTVHGHLSRLAVAAGDRVRAGHVLGTVGDTGSLRGTVLYFEIRHRGLPQDPKLFMGRR